MAMKAPFWTKPYLFVHIHTGSGNPYAVRVNSKKLLGLILMVGITFGSAILGSLFFFRELEVNRKLQERLLVLETKDKIAKHLPPATRTVAANSQTSKTEPQKKTIRQAAMVQSPPAQTPQQKAFAMVTARIANLNSQCLDTACNIKISMVPTSPGLAQGQLLIVLETEIPRIGSANPTSNIRRRFFVYPGYQTHDQLDQQKLDGLKRKTYRFSRALNTTAEFNIGKLLRPLAVNVYLFDKAGNGIHHERRTIERGD